MTSCVPDEMAVTGLIRPNRMGSGDDGGGGKWTEVAPVQAAFDSRVHQEDLVVAKVMAALPDWQPPSEMVVEFC